MEAFGNRSEISKKCPKTLLKSLFLANPAESKSDPARRGSRARSAEPSPPQRRTLETIGNTKENHDSLDAFHIQRGSLEPDRPCQNSNGFALYLM